MIDFNVTKVNGDPQPPDEMNSIFAEVKTMVSSLGVAFVPGSTQQLAEAIATLVMNGQYYTDTGVANAYVLSVTPATRKAPIAYITGMIVSFISGNASTGASTVNIAGLGVKTINQADGTAIEAGDITTTGLTTLYYDGAGFRKVNDRINLAASQEVKGILPIANGGTGSALTAFCNLVSNVVGTLPTANGGTGATAAANAANGVVVLDASGYFPNSSVDTTALKTAQGEVSGANGNYILPGGEYGFYPRIKQSGGTPMEVGIAGVFDVVGPQPTVYTTYISFRREGGSATMYAQQRYVTASGTDWFVYLQVDKATKEIISLYSAPDHVSYGSGGDYIKLPHPFGNIDLGKYEIVILDKETISQLQVETTDIDEETGTPRLATLINEDYKVNLTKKEPYIPLHSGEFKKTLEGGKEVVIKHMIETIPEYISVRKLTKLTQEEKEEREAKRKLEQEKCDMAQAQKLANKASGLNKLKALGLTKEEIEAIA